LTRLFLIPFLLAGALAKPAIASAQVTPAAGVTPKNDTQSDKFGVTIFTDFTVQQSPKSTDADGNPITPNSFNVGRAYVNFTGTINHAISFRITPDIARESGSGSSINGSYTVRLKYAFAQFGLDDWMSTAGSWIRLGLQQTPWVDFEEGLYRYRFQGTVFPDRNSFLTSSDSGVSMRLTLSHNLGDIHFGVYNGEGYSKAEANNTKAFQIRASIRPMPTGALVARGLRVSGFYDADNYLKDGEKRRGLFNVSFEHSHFNFAAEYLAASDRTSVTKTVVKASGYSVWITPFFQQKGNGWEALLRFDGLTPNKNLDATRRNTIVGIAYWFPHPGGSASAAILLDYDYQTFPGTTKQQKIAVHGLVNF
jgi:hypothetical protein